MQTSALASTSNSFDVRPFKMAVEKHLKPESTLRAIVMMEPDFLSPEEFYAKVRIFARLIEQEFKE